MENVKVRFGIVFWSWEKFVKGDGILDLEVLSGVENLLDGEDDLKLKFSFFIWM